MRRLAVPLSLLLVLAVAAGRQRGGSARGLDPPPELEPEPDLDFGDLGDDEGLAMEPEVGPVVGIVARRRRPPSARNYVHAAKAQGAFGMDVFKLLAARDNTTNIIFSPISVGSALAMLLAGSRGETAAQLWTALHLSGARRAVMHSHRRLVRHMRKHSQDGLSISIASDLFTSEALPLNPKFPRYASNMFGSSVTPVPFDFPELTAELINGRFFNVTNGTIDGIVTADMLGEETQFVLANAVSFRGTWLMEFEERATETGLFYSPLGPRVVDMMTAEKEFPLAYLPHLNARALLMPYKGEELGMLILLPNAPDGLPALAQSLNTSTVSDTVSRLEALGDVRVQLPRFEVEEELDLRPVLTELGVADLFDPTLVNMTRITGLQGAAITTAVHKAHLSVSERGTEASAATAFANFFRSVPDALEPFIVDRPFVFALLEMRSSALLFLGRVTALGGELDGLDEPL